MSLSIVIPTFNGKPLLDENLPQVMAAAPNAEIIVVDDASTDGTAAFISARFPHVKLVQLPCNRGFAQAVNAGVAHAVGDIVVLFNNDVSPHPHCLANLDRQFSSNPKLFCVGFLETDPRDKHERGKSISFWRKGLVHHAPAPNLESGPSFWAFAAAAAYRKSMWQKLGGLDSLFRPAYWEDIDLCYQAHKQGWLVTFDSTRQVAHPAESTMKSVLGKRMHRTAFKNQLLFVWKNIDSSKLLLAHLFWLPVCIAYDFPGFLLALIQLPESLINRFNKLPSVISDETILNSDPGR